MEDYALIIEGGGMRGAFSMGVLNGMNDAGIHFPYIIGMSSGALCGLVYLSQQRELAKGFFAEIAQAGEKAFGLKPWLKGKGLFNLSYIAETLTGEDQVDYDRVFNHPAHYLIGTTLAKSGELVFWHKNQAKTPRALQRLVTASASLPVLSPPVRIHGESYVDGGIIDSIPLEKALADGCKKIVVIHTQPREYQKSRQRLELISQAWLRRFPVLKRALQTRHLRYNATLKKLFQMEREGQAFVYCPENSAVSRYGIDASSLNNYYHQGYGLFWEYFPALLDFLGLEEPSPPQS